VQPRFATLFYGVLTSNGAFAYSNAGHQPPVLVRGSRTTVLDAGGPILGVFDDAEFPEASLSLLPGDRIVVVSDGVTDATAPDESDFGMARLLAAAGAAGHRDPAALLAHLLDTIREFSAGSPALDDVTIAVVQYRTSQSTALAP
jgi:sigma-B regulation protein RsbU (phosphoserine phosphatase)